MKIIGLNKKLVVGLLSFTFLFAPLYSYACTSLAIQDKEGRVYHGRTLEYEKDLPSYLTYYPEGQVFKNKTPDNKGGLSYTSNYKILAITMPLLNDDDRSIVEGLNSEGLAFSENMYNVAEPAPLPKDQYPQALPLPKIGEWALAHFKTVDQVKEALQKQPVWSPRFEVSLLKNLRSPFHFAFYDRSGKSIVVEYTQGKLAIYDNPTGAMTNAPSFAWHLTNLNNYAMLTNQDAVTKPLGKITLKDPDTGSATTMLPASDTSVGRFVRAAFYSAYANKVDNADQQLLELSHIMNKFDRPKNITVGSNNESEYTLWTVLSDLNRGYFMVRTYNELGYSQYSFETFSKANQAVFKKII